METDKVETEIVRRVHFDGHCLEVGEWPDSPDVLELRAPTPEDADYWGQIRLTLNPKFALALGLALVDAAKEKLK